MRATAALVETPGGPFTLHDVEIDEPRPDEILVRITAAGICHTDLTMRRAWPQQRLPMIFGHEGTGVVEAVGARISSVAPGDTVCLSYRSCGNCPECSSNNRPYCERSDLNTRGGRSDAVKKTYSGFFGQSSFATYALTHESNTVKIPADFPPALAAPLGCGVQTGAGTVINVLEAGPGDTLVIFGAGSVGLSAVMAAAVQGATVFAVDPIPERRDLARELGAAEALDPATPDLVKALRALTEGGAQHAIDTTGRPDAIEHAIGSLRRRGTLALVGMGGSAGFDIMTVMANGIRIRGVIEGDADPATFIPQLIDMKLPLEKIVTEYPFADIETAAQDAIAGRTIKPVLLMDR
ncbi:aryl-alcohol dehydrogenase [Actinoplanes lutulentus]|uniref:Aryl-alcohol dehydrogenase n=1 Tax=Actinoplanes lutulentus TaxID=1287878 RepID=A0A327ZKJ7_9ACTN|nr:NAD(P)-dependent alcohol dehydrogenase [Actinoplanes lutulentus]MBB2940850.1 aryl-alcohol dehydrogenase [Actinoplanes lutulentus]RAK43159.1 aryl-alcohol dehydrogenase [Actinoplanes lutulentus]